MRYPLLILLLLGLLLLPQESWGTEVLLSLNGGRATKAVKSLKELREEGVTLQKLDYSCGAAALATVLNHFFQDPVTEDIIIGSIFVSGQTPEEGLKKYFKRKGFSLLDLKRISEFRGFKAVGYKEMTLEDLAEVLQEERVPVLVSIQPFGYHHFVVVRGIQGSRIFLADPAIGNMTMSLARFLDVWVEGIGFVITKQPLARSFGVRPSDEDLAKITAAGNGAAPNPPLVPSTPPPALAIRPSEPVPDFVRLWPFTQQQASPVNPRYVQTFADDRGNQILAIFSIQKFPGGIQLGRPPGDFIDFSPPGGRPITSQPSQ